MKFLFVLHDPPNGSERTYNGLRWARQMLAAAPTDEIAHGVAHEVKVFLFSDAVTAAVNTDSEGQTVPEGASSPAPNPSADLGAITRALVDSGVAVGCCGACLDTRGLGGALITGVHRSSMAELAEWTAWADQVINV